MSWFSLFAVYFIMWWIVLFLVLPIGIRTCEEEGEVVPGSVPSAPADPKLLLKFLITSIITGILFFICYWGIEITGIQIKDIQNLYWPTKSN